MKRRNCICTNSKRFIILLFVISTLLYTTLLNNSLSGRILDATVIHDQDLSTKSEDQPIEKEKELDSAINKFINHHSLSEKLATTKSNLLRVSLMKESAKIEDMLIQKEILVKPNAPSKNTLKKSPLVKMIEHLTYKDQSNLLNPHDIALVTYWVPQINNEARVHFEESIYTKIADISLTNIAKYAHQQGYAFFFQNRHLVDTQSKAAYWGKMDVMRYYLSKGFKWVIWTDIDVLFMTNGSLLDEWIRKSDPSKHHIALVDECGQSDDILRRGDIRSGFIAVRNSEEGFAFLDAWTSSFQKYEKSFNPDQEALEDLTKLEPWKSMSHIGDFSILHSYPICFDRDPVKAISLHFPGNWKNNIGDYLKKVEKNEMDEEQLIISVKKQPHPQTLFV